MTNMMGEGSDIRISVLIATHNRHHILLRTLPTLFNQDFPSDQYEVVIVIDGSTDDTAKVLSQMQPACALRVIEQPNRGQAAARNLGIKAARGQIVLLLDDDLLCDSRLLQQHAESHVSNPRCLIVGRTILSADSPKTAAREFRARYNDANFPSDNSGRDWLACATVTRNTSLERSLFLEFGGFDETFCVSEDIEFGIRLHNAGVKLRYQPDAVCEEIYEKTTEQVIASCEEWDGKIELRLCEMHPAYRPLSSFSAESFWQGPKSWGWRALISLWPLLKQPFSGVSRLLEFLLANKFFSNLAVRVFGIRQRTSTFVTAMKQTGSWKAMQQKFGRRLPVLLYHYVGHTKSGTLPSLTVSPEKFSTQIQWLSTNKYQLISPVQWLDWCRTGAGFPDKAVLLTFDDAYADLCDHALPLLRQYGFSAEVFVVTGMIGSSDQWNCALATANHALMTEQQIRQWNSKGIEFGAHSRTHSDLRELSIVALLDEVAGSSDDLNAISGTRPRSFAFPYGRYDQNAVDKVRDHYAMAFTVEEGLNGLATDLHSLRRTMVQPRESLFEFGLRVRFGRNPLIGIRLALSYIKRFLQGRHS